MKSIIMVIFVKRSNDLITLQQDTGLLTIYRPVKIKVFTEQKKTARPKAITEPLVLVVALPDFLSVSLIALVTAPDLFAKPPAAVGANNLRRKNARAACRFANRAAALYFYLNRVKFARFDDGGMAVLDVVLLNLASILNHLLGEEIRAVDLLQKRVAFVFFISQD